VIESVKWEELTGLQEGFFRDALEEAKKSRCCSSKVGCVLTNTGRWGEIIGGGFNETPSPAKSCEELGGCPNTSDGKCTNTVHAERMAIHDADGVYYDNAYITREPCYACVNELRLETSAKNLTIYALDGKPNEDGRAAIKRCGVRLVVVTDWEGQNGI